MNNYAIHYLNLTNGLEYIPLFRHSKTPFGLIRIQSTHCEQKRWNDIIYTLPDGFLMNIAVGALVVVHDASPKHTITRALWQGIPFIIGTLDRVWLDRKSDVFFKDHNATKYFEKCFAELDKKTITKLKYFKKFLFTDEINIEAKSTQTSHDGDYEYYRKLVGEAEQ